MRLTHRGGEGKPIGGLDTQSLGAGESGGGRSGRESVGKGSLLEFIGYVRDASPATRGGFYPALRSTWRRCFEKRTC